MVFKAVTHSFFILHFYNGKKKRFFLAIVFGLHYFCHLNVKK